MKDDMFQTIKNFGNIVSLFQWKFLQKYCRLTYNDTIKNIKDFKDVVQLVLKREIKKLTEYLE